jgi:hypothetical protein
MPALAASYLSATFGIEIECYLPDGTTTTQLARAVCSRGFDCRVETYNHGRRTWWKIVPDGSLQDYSRGIELVSPVLSGEAGLRQIEDACRALTDFGCTVSKKCGMHVHVGVADQPISFYRSLVKLYAAYEGVIDLMMPPSRRNSACNYAKSITHVRPAAVDACLSREALVVLLAQHDPESQRRFRKVNLKAYDRHKTVEFRQHSGTTDAVKCRNWTLVCLRMVAAAKAPAAPVVASGASANQARIGSKAWRVGQMLLRAEGVTGPEIMAALSWPSVSIPAQARACGLSFTTQRMGRVVRYFARASVAEATVSAPVTVDGFATVLGADGDLAAWMRQRTSDLSGAVAWAA